MGSNIKQTAGKADDFGFLNEHDLAARWKMSARTLERWRRNGSGPAFVRIGGAIRYRLDDIQVYETLRRQNGTRDLNTEAAS